MNTEWRDVRSQLTGQAYRTSNYNKPDEELRAGRKQFVIFVQHLYEFLSVRPFGGKFAVDLISYVNNLLSALWIKHHGADPRTAQLLLMQVCLPKGKNWNNSKSILEQKPMWKCTQTTPPTPNVYASHTAYCDISDEFLTAWLLASWTVTWSKWRHKEETQGSGLGEVGCWGVKLSGCKIALQTCSSFSVCWWALNAQSLIHHHLYSFAFFACFVPLLLLFFEGLPSL